VYILTDPMDLVFDHWQEIAEEKRREKIKGSSARSFAFVDF